MQIFDYKPRLVAPTLAASMTHPDDKMQTAIWSGSLQTPCLFSDLSLGCNHINVYVYTI